MIYAAQTPNGDWYALYADSVIDAIEIVRAFLGDNEAEMFIDNFQDVLAEHYDGIALLSTGGF